jgi:predicted ArsR family transcriptional regulator
LIERPVVSSDLVAVLVDVSERAARAALTMLADRGILEPFAVAPVGPGRPRRFWMAPDVIALITAWTAS